MRERGEVQGGGDERLPRAGGGVQDDVLPLEELEDGLLLRRVEREALAGHVVEEAPEQLVAARGVAGGQEIVERAGHGPLLWASSTPLPCRPASRRYNGPGAQRSLSRAGPGRPPLAPPSAGAGDPGRLRRPLPAGRLRRADGPAAGREGPGRARGSGAPRSRPPVRAPPRLPAEPAPRPHPRVPARRAGAGCAHPDPRRRGAPGRGGGDARPAAADGGRHHPGDPPRDADRRGRRPPRRRLPPRDARRRARVLRLQRRGGRHPPPARARFRGAGARRGPRPARRQRDAPHLRRRPHRPHLLDPQRPLGRHRGRRLHLHRARPGRGRRPLPRHAPRGAAARLRGGEAGARRVPGRHRPRGGRPHRQLAAHRRGRSSSATAS